MPTARKRKATAAAVVVRVAIYLRISKDEHDLKLGVDRQEEAVREMLDREYGPDGWTEVGVYCDNNISAWSGARRPQYERLMGAPPDAKRRKPIPPGDVERGLIDVVAVWDTDRLYRRTKDLEWIIDVLGADPRTGVDLKSATSGFYDLSTANGRYYARMDAARSQHESDHKSERIRLQTAKAVKSGWPPQRPGYGYRHVWFGRQQGGTLEIVEEEAVVLRWLAARVLDDVTPLSRDGVARAANRAGMTMRNGRPWTGADVSDVLLRPTVAAKRRRPGDGEMVEGKWPAIFDDEMWRLLRDVLEDPNRKHVRDRSQSHYWLCGVLVDDWDRLMVGGRNAVAHESGPGTYGRRTYRSPWPTRGHSVGVDADAVEAYLLEAVRLEADALQWDEPADAGPTPEAVRVRRLDDELGDLGVKYQRKELRKVEYDRQRAELLRQVEEAERDADRARSRRRRTGPAVAPGDVARRWELPTHKGGLSDWEKREVARWALGRVTVLPGGGGRYATRPEGLKKRLVIADGPLARAGRAPARLAPGRPSARGARSRQTKSG
jgi:DNA invertase Pin-like site-specific DNA recombinase